MTQENPWGIDLIECADGGPTPPAHMSADSWYVGVYAGDHGTLLCDFFEQEAEARRVAQILAPIAEVPAMVAAAREALAAWDMEEDTAEHNHEDRLEAALARFRAILARIDGEA